MSKEERHDGVLCRGSLGSRVCAGPFSVRPLISFFPSRENSASNPPGVTGPGRRGQNWQPSPSGPQNFSSHTFIQPSESSGRKQRSPMRRAALDHAWRGPEALRLAPMPSNYVKKCAEISEASRETDPAERQAGVRAEAGLAAASALQPRTAGGHRGRPPHPFTYSVGLRQPVALCVSIW